MESPDALRVFHELDAVHRPRKDDFYRRSAERRGGIFVAIKNARNRLLNELFTTVANARSESEPLAALRRKIYAYFERADWAFLDLVALAACTSAPEEHIATALAPNALAYHSLRMLDDVLDGHHDYKGGTQTLFGELCAEGESTLASHANLITAMLIVTSTALPDHDRRLLERTLAGMLHESFPGDWRELESYRQIALAKMGAYGLFLYGPVLAMFEPAIQPALEQFLLRSFVISQFVNDLQDRDDDEQRAQPNYWLIGRTEERSMQALRKEIETLAYSCVEIPRPARDYTHARVTDLLGYLHQVLQADDQNRRRRAVQAS